MVLHFPGGANGKDPVCQFRRPSLGREDPLEEGMATTPAFLPGESPQGRKDSDMTEQLTLSYFQLAGVCLLFPPYLR